MGLGLNAHGLRTAFLEQGLRHVVVEPQLLHYIKARGAHDCVDLRNSVHVRPRRKDAIEAMCHPSPWWFLALTVAGSASSTTVSVAGMVLFRNMTVESHVACISAFLPTSHCLLYISHAYELVREILGALRRARGIREQCHLAMEASDDPAWVIDSEWYEML